MTAPSIRNTTIAIALALVTAAAFWRVSGCAFINYDDPDYVTRNPMVASGLSASGVAWAFTTFHAANWHPLTWLSHMLDVSLFGLNPAGHHLTSLLIHIANTLLIFALLRRMTGAVWRPAFVAALFAVHPLHVETVAWVSERKDVLSTFFGLLSLRAYAAFATAAEPRAKIRRYGFALLFFALSLLSKPMLVTLPCLLLLLDVWPLGRLQAGVNRQFLRSTVRLAAEKLPFFILTAASCAVTLVAQRQGGAVSSLEAIPLGARLANAAVSVLLYVGKMFWPADLAVLYPHPGSWPAGVVTVAVAILLLVTAAALMQLRSRPFILVGWLWFLGTLIPVIGLVQVGVQSMADRYTYFPMVGLFVLFAWQASGLLPRSPAGRRVLAASASAVVLACVIATTSQLRHWKDSESLFRHTLAVTKNNAVAHTNLGIALSESGRPAEARAELARALELKPNFPPALAGLGSIDANEGRLADAVRVYRRTLELRPSDPVSHFNLAVVLAAQGAVEEAAARYREALALYPGYTAAHNNLANLLIRGGKAEEGLSHALAAVRLDPDSAMAHLNAANALFLLARLDEADAHYLAAIKAAPDLAEAHLNLAKIRSARGRMDDAERHLGEVIRLKPGNTEARVLQAAIYMGQKRAREAAFAYADLLRLAPDSPEVMNNLAWVLATAPDPAVRNGAEAVRVAARACELTGHANAALLSTLAAAYAEAARFSDAVRIQRQVADMLDSAGQSGRAAAARERVALSESGRPLRDP